MKEQDKRAVEGMARCGISLEGLIKAFPNFPVDEVTEVYSKINKNRTNYKENHTISRNCS